LQKNSLPSMSDNLIIEAHKEASLADITAAFGVVSKR
jgi:hypothetical protein